MKTTIMIIVTAIILWGVAANRYDREVMEPQRQAAMEQGIERQYMMQMAAPGAPIGTTAPGMKIK